MGRPHTGGATGAAAGGGGSGVVCTTSPLSWTSRARASLSIKASSVLKRPPTSNPASVSSSPRHTPVAETPPRPSRRRSRNPQHAGVRAELQGRADRGRRRAPRGTRRTPAAATAPMLEAVHGKLTAASAATDPAQASALRGEANDLTAKAAETQRQYLAPVLAQAHGDAAYGLGVQRACVLGVAGRRVARRGDREGTSEHGLTIEPHGARVAPVRAIVGLALSVVVLAGCTKARRDSSEGARRADNDEAAAEAAERGVVDGGATPFADQEQPPR